MHNKPLYLFRLFIRQVLRGCFLCIPFAIVASPVSAQEGVPDQDSSPGFTLGPKISSPQEGLRILRDPRAAAAISADELMEDRKRKRIIGRGFIDLRFRSKRVQADHIEVQTETRDAVAIGNIIFQSGNDRIVGSRIEFNLDSEKLVIYDARGYIGATYYVTANVIRRIAEDRYEVFGGTFTTCEGDNPDWAFQTKKASFQIEGYANLQSPMISLRGIPAAALPYAIFPIKTKRATGFLTPAVGLGNKNGLQISPRFFWAINKWSDVTLGLDYFTRRGTRYLAEYRYALSENTSGKIRASTLKDLREKTTLWDINVAHVSRFPRNRSEFKAVVEEASRVRADRSLENNLDYRVRQETDTRLTFTHNLRDVPGQFSVSMRRREGLRENDGQLFQRFPEASLDIDQAQIGTSDFRFNLDSSFVSFFRVLDNNTTVLQRFDMAPSVSLPLRAFPWLGITPRFGVRYTYWTNQKRSPDANDNPARDDQKEAGLSREIWFSTVNIVGPRLSKVYIGEIGPFRDFKHILSFESEYAYTPAMDSKDRRLIIPIDSVDGFDDKNTIRYGIVNRVLTKLKKDKGSQSHQLFAANLFQTLNIDEARREQNLGTNPRRSLGDAELVFQARPIPLVRLTHLTNYNVYEGKIDNYTTGLLLDGGRNWYFNVDRTWNRSRSGSADPQIGRSDFNFSGGYALTRQWFVEYLTRINNIENETLEQSMIFRYRGCCWGFNLSFTDTQDTSEVFLTFIIQGLLEGEGAPTFNRRQKINRRGRLLGGGPFSPFKFDDPGESP